MSTNATFLWGCFGALLGYLLVFTVPWLKKQRDYDLNAEPNIKKKRPSLIRIAAAGGLFLTYVILGGGAALLIGGAIEPKHAMAYGLTWEAVLKGLTQDTDD